jgi:predicted nucleotidyltransferase
MQPMPILRAGSYHDTQADPQTPSATAVRQLITENSQWQTYIPQAARNCFEAATIHRLAYGETAILGKLRTMSEAEFEALPYGSEGLWRKLMHAARTKTTLEDILTATKSKRYTRTRLDRMVMCAFLGITENMLNEPVPYTRVLAFNDTGREILKQARSRSTLINAGEVRPETYQQLEDRCGDLYGLFSQTPEAPGRTRNERIFYAKEV